MDIGSDFWVQINRVGPAHLTRMGILTASPPTWSVTGQGSDSSDRERIKLIRYVMAWMAKESNLFHELLWVLKDYDTCGMGWLRLRWDKFKRTRNKTIGMTWPERLNPLQCYPDDRARGPHVLDGRYCAYVTRMLKEEFREKWGQRVLPDGTVKKVNVDRIFRDIEDSNHIDFKLNAGRNDSQKEITLIQYDYFRMIEKESDIVPGLRIPTKEYRVALVAGNEILVDYESDISDLELWTMILFAGEPMLNLPYSSSGFPAVKALQDLYNTMLSMTINNQARQMNSPLEFYEGSLINENMWKTSGSKAGAMLKWKYTQEMLAAAIPPEVARPRRMPPGQLGSDWLHVLASVDGLFDKVATKSIVQGENQPGVTSGKHAALLQAQGLQPSYYQKQQLEAPLERVGNVYYCHAKTYITDEMELPVDDEGSGVEKGIKINHILGDAEIIKIAEAVKSGDLSVGEQLKMVSVRIGDERLSLEEWVQKGGNIEQLLGLESREEGPQLVENDITFGSFNVTLSIDPSAENTKIQKREQWGALSQIILSMGAKKTAVKYLMEAMEIPNRNEIMTELEEELGQQAAMGMVGGEQGITQPGQGV